jgi:hypothetical protein
VDFALIVAAVLFGAAGLYTAIYWGRAAVIRAKAQRRHAKSQMLYAISDHEWWKHRIAKHRDAELAAELDAIFDEPEDGGEGGAAVH